MLIPQKLIDAVAVRSADQPPTVSSGLPPDSLLASHNNCSAIAQSFSTYRVAIISRDGRLLRKSELISSWLNEDMDTLNDSCSDDSENDENTISVERHNEENYEGDEPTENTSDESEPDNEGENEYYLGKDKITKWKKNPPPRNTRTAHCNIITHLPGVKPHARNAKTIIESWSLFFPDNVIQEIVTLEIRGLFGLLYIAGMMKSNHLNLSDLWSNDGLSPEYFRAVM
ncbi:hypothetical protein QTP88_001729 [Uroleucon formosanum]